MFLQESRGVRSLGEAHVLIQPKVRSRRSCIAAQAKEP
jgi:hypothetical protein